MSYRPRYESHGRADRFQRSRGLIDNQAPVSALMYLHQFMHNGVDMPVVQVDSSRSVVFLRFDDIVLFDLLLQK